MVVYIVFSCVYDDDDGQTSYDGRVCAECFGDFVYLVETSCLQFWHKKCAQLFLNAIRESCVRFDCFFFFAQFVVVVVANGDERLLQHFNGRKKELDWRRPTPTLAKVKHIIYIGLCILMADA